MANKTSQQLRMRPTLVDDTIVFCDERLFVPTHRPIRILGQGKNGFVVLCHNRLLNRTEALKVWAKRDLGDSRDKFQQGMDEAQKAAAASEGRFVAQIYSAGVLLEKYLYATMEYVPGPTLHDYLAEQDDDRRHALAQRYVRVVCRETGGVLHGDAHARNVIVTKIRGVTHLKLIDFGTSRFTGSEKFVDRHWRVVDETIRYILCNSQRYKRAMRRMMNKSAGWPKTDYSIRDQWYDLMLMYASRDYDEDTDN